MTGARGGEPYVPQDAHQRFLIEAWLFLGKKIPSSPLPWSTSRRPSARGTSGSRRTTESRGALCPLGARVVERVQSRREAEARGGGRGAGLGLTGYRQPGTLIEEVV